MKIKRVDEAELNPIKGLRAEDYVGKKELVFLLRFDDTVEVDYTVCRSRKDAEHAAAQMMVNCMDGLELAARSRKELLDLLREQKYAEALEWWGSIESAYISIEELELYSDVLPPELPA